MSVCLPRKVKRGGITCSETEDLVLVKHCEYWEENPGPVQEHPVLLNSESFLNSDETQLRKTSIHTLAVGVLGAVI